MTRIGWILPLAAAFALVPGAWAQSRKPPKTEPPAAPDAKEILRESRSAILTMRTVTYNARVEPIGASARAYPTTNAVVGVQRMITGSPVMAKVSIRGESKRPGEAGARAVHFVYDGRDMLWKNPDGTVGEAEPGDAHAALLAREELLLVPRDLLLEQPLTHIIDTGSAAYEGRKNIEGAECDVVLVEYTPRTPANAKAQTVRWYLGSDDNLPRRLEYPLKIERAGQPSEDGGVMVTLAQLQPDTPLESSMFRIDGPRATPPVPKRPPPPDLKPRRGLLAVGEAAPDWALKDAAGKEVRLSDLKGKVVLLDFWATWCPPCRKVMPEIEALHQKYKDKGVAVIGVSTFERRDPVEGPAAYMKQQGFTYGLLVKGDAVAQGYGVEAIPTIYVIGTDGRVAFRTKGVMPGDTEKIEKTIEHQLRAKR